MAKKTKIKYLQLLNCKDCGKEFVGQKGSQFCNSCRTKRMNKKKDEKE